MKRPILIATIGFTMGIIWGLYFNMVSFLLLLGIVYINLYIIKYKKAKFLRIVKLFITEKTIILFTIFFLISNLYITYLEKDYSKTYNSLGEIQCVGTIISEKEEKNYSYQYKIKLEKVNNTKIKDKIFYVTVNKKKKIDIKFADKISFRGEYIRPEIQRNYMGFNYSMYLKSQGIYGTINIKDNIQFLRGNNLNYISIFSNKLRNRIIENINKLFTEQTKGIFLGVLMGDDGLITNEVRENFSKSSLSHLLAVSGSHVSYVVLGIIIVFKFIRIPKKIEKVLTCILLIFYLYLIDFSPSVTRAVIMSIIGILNVLFERKQDIATTISFSSLLILITNPYKIINIGFILSYSGTVGIVIFAEEIEKLSEKQAKIKILKIIKGMCFVTVSAQILIFPIIIYYFNTVSLTFIISNIIAGFLIGPITIIGLIIIIFSFVNLKISLIIVRIYNVLLLILLKSTEILAKIPISNIYLKTPGIISILVYYLIVFIIFVILVIKRTQRYYLNKKLNILIHMAINTIKNNVIKVTSIVLLIHTIFFIYNKIPKDLKINFVDVGQGDCTLITTMQNKKILVDSGGSETYDVGKNTLFPYLLDRGITKIDYIIISHFDTDHCKGFEYVMKDLNVKNVIISRQPEFSENYKELLKIAKERKINIIYVNEGDELKIEEDLSIKILWPDYKKFITENRLNNNSIVCKLIYKKFSMIFTGDIEKIAEEKILEKYEKSNILRTTILKVAHHGSKTSSIEEMLNKINPKIALIGVGNDNKFGHPNNEVIERLKSHRY